MSEPKSHHQEQPFRVLFVCTGNTCRSATAEGVLRKMVADMPDPHPDIEVQSAGTLGMVGAPATDLAIAVAADFGVDIGSHLSQAVTPELLDRSDLVLAMAGEHYQDCLALGASAQALYMLLHYPEHRPDSQKASVPDPIGGDRQRYETVFLQIDEALRRSLRHIVTAAKREGKTDSS